MLGRKPLPSTNNKLKKFITNCLSFSTSTSICARKIAGSNRPLNLEKLLIPLTFVSICHGDERKLIKAFLDSGLDANIIEKQYVTHLKPSPSRLR